ncbi:MAG: hypothetical protein K6F15_03115 [Treponema sp.]|nr:hypothetical protein [Treponema sp.]
MLRKSLLSVLSLLILFGLFVSCDSKVQEKRLVIWTDSSEMAPFLEIYNRDHKTKVVLVYKDNLAASIPPVRDELQPDLIIGNWLRNSRIKKTFEPVDFLFERKYISSNFFYKSLLDAGKIKHSQYLLPVSFNLPAIIFSRENTSKLENSYTISLEQLRNAGAEFNTKNKKGAYTAIGFAPQSSSNFMFTVTQVKGSNFREEKNGSFSWDQDQLQKSISFLNQWISEENTSTQTESDFVYKYLSVTDDKKVTGGRTLFAYTTSDSLFTMTPEQLEKIDFRWLEYENLIPVDDSIKMLGIYKKSSQQAEASDFISTFFSSEMQKKFLERKTQIKADNRDFGFFGGFSTVRDVTEHILPIYYTTLLSNIPEAGTFCVYPRKPENWEHIKERVVLPFIEESVAGIPGKKVQTIEERYSDLKKLGY